MQNDTKQLVCHQVWSWFFLWLTWKHYYISKKRMESGILGTIKESIKNRGRIFPTKKRVT